MVHPLPLLRLPFARKIHEWLPDGSSVSVVIAVAIVPTLWTGGLAFVYFQAEDGIRDWSVTGVQTCALPISPRRGDAPPGRAQRPRPRADRRQRRLPHRRPRAARPLLPGRAPVPGGSGPLRARAEIGRASCRERVESSGGAVAFEKESG